MYEASPTSRIIRILIYTRYSVYITFYDVNNHSSIDDWYVADRYLAICDVYIIEVLVAMVINCFDHSIETNLRI